MPKMPILPPDIIETQDGNETAKEFFGWREKSKTKKLDLDLTNSD